MRQRFSLRRINVPDGVSIRRQQTREVLVELIDRVGVDHIPHAISRVERKALMRILAEVFQCCR